jgi:signal transduction histidine kinase/CheY-like chemotaxis protein
LPVRGLLSPVRDVDGLPTGFIAVLTDASAFHHRQAELSAAKDAAEAADRAKGDFLAVISHEVRTPLNGIVGFTNLLLDTPLTSEQREYVQTIRTSGEALVQLTGDILDFSRIASGSVPLEAAPCDVRGIVEDTLDIFARHAAERRIELLHHIDPDVPLQVLADPGRLRQVLVNLVGNAIKFTPSGEVALTLRVLTGKAHSLAPFDALTPGQLVAELDDGSLALEFAVRDTGIGIAPEDRAKLFQPFTQLDATSVRRYGGAGLGLAISRMLVRLMGGDIWLESEPGRGSTFSFTVRVCPAPGTEPPSSPPSLVGRRIALAIPSASLRRELTAVLTAAAAQPIDVPAEAPLVESGWDLAIVDLDANARQRLRTLPAPAPTLAARIFGLVDVTFPSTERRTLRTHVRMLLNKPVHQRTLLDLLARALERPRDREPTAAALHVLVAEDDDVHRRATQGLLEHLGCICDGARDGRECLRRIAQTPYDVMFLDVHLPELDGLSVLRAVRAGEAGAASRTLWVAVLTADRRDEMRDMVFSAGADDFLAKPFSLAAAETTLRRRASARAATEPPVGR